MHVKFVITLEDGSTVESHDEMWNTVKDHAHALHPNNTKKWKKYRLQSDEGQYIEVDFETGVFDINGAKIHPGDEIYEHPLTNDSTPQDFPVDTSWGINNGLPYFPVAGRRYFKSSDPTLNGQFELTLYFCGWKKKFGDKVVQKLAFLMPDGEVVLT